MRVPPPLPLPRRLKYLLFCGCGIICLLIPLRVRYFLSLVEGESMLPSLRPRDVLLIDKFAYNNGPPSRGDIVMARYHNGLILKRIVGLPGEDIEVKSGTLYVNGTPIAEDHGIRKGPLDSCFYFAPVASRSRSRWVNQISALRWAKDSMEVPPQTSQQFG